MNEILSADSVGIAGEKNEIHRLDNQCFSCRNGQFVPGRFHVLQKNGLPARQLEITGEKKEKMK